MSIFGELSDTDSPLMEKGNINLFNRPVHQNKDGSISTVRSMSFNEDGKEILIPTISDEGQPLTSDQAIQLYHKTGKYLGKFDTIKEANRYAESLHEQQARLYKSNSLPPSSVFEDLASVNLPSQKSFITAIPPPGEAWKTRPKGEEGIYASPKKPLVEKGLQFLFGSLGEAVYHPLLTARKLAIEQKLGEPIFGERGSPLAMDIFSETVGNLPFFIAPETLLRGKLKKIALKRLEGMKKANLPKGAKWGEQLWDYLEPVRKKVSHLPVVPGATLQKTLGAKTLEELFIPASERMPFMARGSFSKHRFRSKQFMTALKEVSSRIANLDPLERIHVTKLFQDKPLPDNLSTEIREKILDTLQPLKDVSEAIGKKLKPVQEELVKDKLYEKMSEMFVTPGNTILKEITTQLPQQKLKSIKSTQKVLKGIIENPILSVDARATALSLHDMPVSTITELSKSFGEASKEILYDSLLKNTRAVSLKPKAGFVFSDMSKLKGLWIEKNTYDGLNELREASRPAGGKIWSGLQKYFITPWKVTRVVARPAAQYRNIFGNVILNDIMGSNPLPIYRLDVYVKALREMKAGSKGFKRFLNITGEDPGTFSNAELQPLITSLKYGSSMPEVFLNYFSKITRPFARFHQFNETWAKYSKFIWNKNKGLPDTEAALDAVKTTFDYTDTTIATKRARETIMPFATWQFKVFRQLPEAIVKHPIRVAKYVAIPAGITLAALNNLDIQPWEWKQIKKDLPDYIAKGEFFLMPWRDARGRLQLFNLTWFLPGIGDIAEQSTNITDPTRFIQNPIMTISADLLRNKSGIDQPIWNEWDDSKVKLGKALMHIYRQAMFTWFPGGIDWNTVYKAINNEPRASTIPQALAAQFGMKLQPVASKGLHWRRSRIEKAWRNQAIREMGRELHKSKGAQEAFEIRQKYLPIIRSMSDEQ